VGPAPEAGDREEPTGTIRPTGHRSLIAAAVVGLVGGWSVRLFALRTGRAEPDVSWTAIGVLLLAAVILAGTAWLTRRVLRADRTRLPHHHAVNRLLLGKACAIAGALLVGAYAGYAIAQLGVGEPTAVTRLWRSALAAVAALAMTASALLLEHVCRVPPRKR
jgi:hypothetical protein